DAGPDQVVNFGDAVTLKGTFSEPATPDTHTYLWQVKDTANNLVPGATSTAAEFTFTPPATETSHPTGTTYTATFTVTDSSGSSDTDTVYINVNKIAPVLTITGGEHVAEGTQLELQVSANRTSGIDPTNYVWTVTRMNRPGSGGGESPLADGAGDRFVFAPEDDGDYRVTVTVPWGSGSLTAVQAITVSNAAPDIRAIT